MPEQIQRYMIHVYEPKECEGYPDRTPGEDAKSDYGDGVLFSDHEQATP